MASGCAQGIVAWDIAGESRRKGLTEKGQPGSAGPEAGAGSVAEHAAFRHWQ